MQLDGRLVMAPGSNAICAHELTTLERGRAVNIVPYWSVGFDLEDPDAAFYERWRSDPQLHLPAGTWHVVAQALICAGPAPADNQDHLLRTPPLVLTIRP